MEIETNGVITEVSDACAGDVMYLRSRYRWSQELEDKLINLHSNGTPPNMMEFGCTEQSGNQLLDLAKKFVKQTKGL